MTMPSVHGVRLMLRSLDVAVLPVVEKGQRENGHPSPLVVTNTVDKEKRCGQFTGMLTWNRVHHPHGMSDHVEPECMRHLFFSYVCTSHVDHGLPMDLDQNISRLMLFRSSDDLGLTIN